MARTTLDAAPQVLPRFAPAAAALLPGAARLPWVPGRGRDLPERTLELAGQEVDRDHLAGYSRVCGFRLRDTLPPTFPHVLAFPLHFALITGGDFPFAPIGLVHLENAITQHRPVRVGERLDLAVRAADLRPHPKGRTFDLVTEVRVEDDLVWESRSTMLRRGGGGEQAGEGAPRRARPKPPPETRGTWRLPGDTGRRYAAVSGDRNPIHLHDLPAKALGFPRAIAHGMYSKARCLAALEGRLPDAFTVEVRFGKPVLLPATVAFGAEPAARNGTRFTLRAAKGDAQHLEGTLTPRKATKGRRR